MFVAQQRCTNDLLAPLYFLCPWASQTFRPVEEEFEEAPGEYENPQELRWDIFWQQLLTILSRSQVGVVYSLLRIHLCFFFVNGRR